MNENTCLSVVKTCNHVIMIILLSKNIQFNGICMKQRAQEWSAGRRPRWIGWCLKSCAWLWLYHYIVAPNNCLFVLSTEKNPCHYLLVSFIGHNCHYSCYIHSVTGMIQTWVYSFNTLAQHLTGWKLFFENILLSKFNLFTKNSFLIGIFKGGWQQFHTLLFCLILPLFVSRMLPTTVKWNKYLNIGGEVDHFNKTHYMY